MDNVTRLPTLARPRLIGSAMQDVLSRIAQAKRQRDMLIEAHRQAGIFHQAMSDALDAEREIDEGDADPHWATKYNESLKRAVEAMNKMPVKWAAILGCELPTPPKDAA